jgi:DNA-directed RNA polymerase subunit beta'
MAQTTTIGKLLIENALPPDMRGRGRTLDAAGVKDLFHELATKHPDKYSDVGLKLTQIGKDASYISGGFSVGVSALITPPEIKQKKREIEKKFDQIASLPIPEKEKQRLTIALAQESQKTISEMVYDHAVKTKNPIGLQAKHGIRGNASNVNSLLGADFLYADTEGRPVPVPVTRSYSEGLTFAQYFAGAFGTRKGVYELKASTADAGFAAKQVNQAAHRLLVTAADDENYDEKTVRGLPVSINDADSIGSLLAAPVGGYKRNQLITPRVLKDLRDQGLDEVLVRSVTVGGPLDGGVYAYDAGTRERGGIAPIGDFIGLAGAQALAEPITQGTISSKHSGGVFGGESKALSTFQKIDALLQVPERFPDGATHADVDGKVERVRDAEQGGSYVLINGKEHYIPTERQLLVKVGDEIEAGDVLSSGTPNPAKIVEHKGIGEGRRYFVQILADQLKSSKLKGARRNIELLARGLINHVRLTDDYEDRSAGETYPYQTLEAQWQPREGSLTGDAGRFKGMYLEKPVLHYTIGTPIKPKMIKNLRKFGVNEVIAHKEPPPFQTEMVRAMGSVAEDPDWMTNLLGSYQQKSLLNAVHTSRTSDASGSSYVPALANPKEFGRIGATKSWDPVKAPLELPKTGTPPQFPQKSLLDGL